MSLDYSGVSHELNRPHDPWERFTRRNVTKHRMEDTIRLCTQDTSSSRVIDICFKQERRPLDDPIPRKNQVLRDFLGEVLDGVPGSTRPYAADILRRNRTNGIVLVDDRQNHADCEKKIRRPCPKCKIFSEKLSIPKLREHLVQNVS